MTAKRHLFVILALYDGSVSSIIPWRRPERDVRTRASEHEAGLQRVAIRLAAQTVALLLVMLIVLEAVVYVITQHTLLGSLETTLKNRAAQSDPTACAALRLPCGPGNGFPGGNRGGQPIPNGTSFPSGGSPVRRSTQRVSNPSDASAVYFTRSLRIVHRDGSPDAEVLAPSDAREAMRIGRAQCCSVVSDNDVDYLVYTSPLLSHNGIAGAVQTSIPETQYERTLHTLLEVLILVAILGLLGSGAISAVLARRALQPIRRAMGRQRDFVADAAHELRTPLAIMRTVGELGMAEPAADELRVAIEQMLGENAHLTRLVEDLSLLARADTDAISIEHVPVNLSALITDTSAEIQPLAEAQGIDLQSSIREGITVLGDAVRLRQLLLILLDNALKHTPEGGTVSVALTAQGDRTRLQVADSGPGINVSDLPRVFDRFYRADQAREGEGSGLGLSIGKWIAVAHGGQIEAANRSSGGAAFTVTLPVSRSAIASSTVRARDRVPPA